MQSSLPTTACSVMSGRRPQASASGGWRKAHISVRSIAAQYRPQDESQQGVRGVSVSPVRQDRTSISCTILFLPTGTFRGPRPTAAPTLGLRQAWDPVPVLRQFENDRFASPTAAHSEGGCSGEQIPLNPPLNPPLPTGTFRGPRRSAAAPIRSETGREPEAGVLKREVQNDALPRCRGAGRPCQKNARLTAVRARSSIG